MLSISRFLSHSRSLGYVDHGINVLTAGNRGESVEILKTKGGIDLSGGGKSCYQQGEFTTGLRFNMSEREGKSTTEVDARECTGV
jgi:hypothetical protein